MASADWTKIKKEYMKGGISYSKLAEKYHVPESTLKHKAVKEGWCKKRKQACTKADTKCIESIAQKNAEIDVSVFDAALKLLKAYADSVEAFSAEGTLPPTMLKDYASALKSIQSVLEKPTDLDIKEQEARIAKLRKDAEKDDNAPSEISITIQGWDESWAE